MVSDSTVSKIQVGHLVKELALVNITALPGTHFTVKIHDHGTQLSKYINLFH
jgi:hypothetical protein